MAVMVKCIVHSIIIILIRYKFNYKLQLNKAFLFQFHEIHVLIILISCHFIFKNPYPILFGRIRLLLPIPVFPSKTILYVCTIDCNN